MYVDIEETRTHYLGKIRRDGETRKPGKEVVRRTVITVGMEKMTYDNKKGFKFLGRIVT